MCAWTDRGRKAQRRREWEGQVAGVEKEGAGERRSRGEKEGEAGRKDPQRLGLAASDVNASLSPASSRLESLPCKAIHTTSRTLSLKRVLQISSRMQRAHRDPAATEARPPYTTPKPMTELSLQTEAGRAPPVAQGTGPQGSEELPYPAGRQEISTQAHLLSPALGVRLASRPGLLTLLSPLPALPHTDIPQQNSHLFILILVTVS